MRWIALLRGVNVGGRHPCPMADLRALVAAAGGRDAQTYIQSGNVVFDHDGTGEAPLRADLESRLAAHLGFAVPVMLRGLPDWRSVVDRVPFPAADLDHVHVLFLHAPPPAGALDALDRAALAPEAFVLDGREVYLHLPGGMGRAKLPAALERALPEPGTARNWRTVLRVRGLADAA